MRLFKISKLMATYFARCNTLAFSFLRTSIRIEDQSMRTRGRCTRNRTDTRNWRERYWLRWRSGLEYLHNWEEGRRRIHEYPLSPFQSRDRHTNIDWKRMDWSDIQGKMTDFARWSHWCNRKNPSDEHWTGGRGGGRAGEREGGWMSDQSMESHQQHSCSSSKDLSLSSSLSIEEQIDSLRLHMKEVYGDIELSSKPIRCVL